MDWFTNDVAPLLIAAALGAAVGIERESWRKPAGLRTHMMVALGSATFTNLALRLVSDASDPARIVLGVATGLGFLGAGSIIRSRGEITGITTASGIWVVGAAGASAGARQYGIAVVSVALALVILAVLGRAERRTKSQG